MRDKRDIIAVAVDARRMPAAGIFATPAFYSLEGAVQPVRLPFRTITNRVRRDPVWAGVLAAAVLIVLLVIWPGWGYRWDWTGFGPIFEQPTHTRGLTGLVGVTQYTPSKTLWDWMQLLLVPLAVAGAASWLNWVQSAREAEREDKRANAEAAREARREQDAVMETYLSQIASLLLHEELGQPTSEGKRAKQVARGQTLTALRRIDGGRKGTVIAFLSDSDLIAVVDLFEADLSGANLALAKLSGANLTRANLSGTDLTRADLTGANLSRADLTGANLTRADLSGAKLTRADLAGADLSGTKLARADLSGASLLGSKLLRSNLTGAKLASANLTRADLSEANLYEANLLGSKLQGSNLTNTRLTGINLDVANLSGAIGTTEEQLKSARSLEGATMPDGSKYAAQSVQSN
jgi:uncharacterized protein YjbI with pentapeptide repeats